MKDKSPSFKTSEYRPEYFVDFSRSFWLALFGKVFGKEFFEVGIEDVAEYFADTRVNFLHLFTIPRLLRDIGNSMK